MADGTQRRRARDRNPQGIGRKIEQRPQLAPPAIRPLSMNPLRPSGPIRRTCGVIKLPVMLLSPPAGDTTLRDSVLGQQGVSDQKSHSLNVVVQSYWEKRLKTLNPQDHVTGQEISRKGLQQQAQQQQQQQAVLQQQTRPDLVNSASTNSSTTTPIPNSAPPIPSLLSSQQLPVVGSALQTSPLSSSTHSSSLISSNRVVQPTLLTNSSPLTGTKLLQVHQLKTITSSNPSPTLTATPHIPQCVTDNDVILQEQRVQLLRQQLMAAQSGL